MTFRFVKSNWQSELAAALAADASHVRIICPFIKNGALTRLIHRVRLGKVEVITRFNRSDFAAGVSDTGALRTLLDCGAEVRGVKGLHAKLYIFGAERAILTSANLTTAALSTNHEFGVVAEDRRIVGQCQRYFDEIWPNAGKSLTPEWLAQMEAEVAKYLATGARPDQPSDLGDEGATITGLTDLTADAGWVGSTSRAFIKFLGEGNDRKPLTCTTLDEIKRAGCHWAVAYPAAKRPTSVADGDIVFIARLTDDPNDIRVFGRAVAMRHVPGRDDATADDIALRPWKEKWPRYVRVHHAEFVAGTMANGVSLNELMAALKSQSFLVTQQNAAKGNGNTDPRRAYRQQPAVRLSTQGLKWLNQRLEIAFAQHGRVSPESLAKLDWP